MIHSLYDEPAPEPAPPGIPESQMIGMMVSAALELARADEETPMPLDTSFDVHVDLAEREIEIIWPCACGVDDCTGDSGSGYGFDELMDMLMD